MTISENQDDQNGLRPNSEVESTASSPESPSVLEPKVNQVLPDVEGKETNLSPNSFAEKPSLKSELADYTNKINDLLSLKENLKLVAIEQKAHKAYYRKWSNEANEYFVLLSLLRKRQKLYSTK